MAYNLLFKQEDSTRQAAELWSMLDLSPGCRLLDAPCGWGRLSRPLAVLGATVLGVDQSETLLRPAETQRGDVGTERLRYLRYDLRNPLPDENFDVACNIFTSFGYGTEEEDLALFRNLRGAVRPGGRVLVETSHGDLFCASLARTSKISNRMADGTIFLDEPEFDAVAGERRAAIHGRLQRAVESSLPSRRPGRGRTTCGHRIARRVAGSKLILIRDD